jgi:hypothetical protein
MVISFCLSGCAQPGGGIAASQTAADDVCRPQRLALDDSQQFFAGDIVKGALVGSAVGALSGFALGGNGQSAAFGALAGGVAGGLAGYWTSQQRQGGSHTDVISRMVGDMDRENQALDKAQVAFNNLVECRRASARQINANLRSGAITREQAEAQMAQVRTLVAQDMEISRRINARIDERTGNYVYATEQATGAPLQTASAPPPPPPPPAAKPGARPAAKPAAPPPQQASAPPPPDSDAAARQSASSLVQKKQSFEQSQQTAQQSLSTEMTISQG